MTHKNTVGFLGGKYLPLHQGHIYMMLESSNLVDELFVVLSSSKNRDKELCAREGIKYIPAEVRLAWLGQALNDVSNAKIIHIEDDQWNHNYDWKRGANMIKEAIGKPIDFVFSSEKSYDEHFKKYYPCAKHVVVDDKRKTVTISATDLRKNLYDHWDKLPNCVRSHFTKKIAIVGTESCGKSTLTKKLAKFYNTNHVHEVGRDYCEKYSNQLTVEMFDQIGMDHYLLQKSQAEKSNKVLLVDSDAVITQYYLDMYFQGHKSQLVEEIVKKQDFDLMIYLEPDIPWVKDGLRFAGEQETRKKNNQILKQMYTDRGIDFVSINGTYSERFKKSRTLIDNLFETK